MLLVAESDRYVSHDEQLESSGQLLPVFPLYRNPPATSSVSPVMYFESDDARYTAVGEISSG